MSRKNVEIVRRLFEAFNEHDLDAVTDCIAPDAEYVSTGTIPGFADVYRGPEGFRRFLGWLWEEFDEPRVEVQRSLRQAIRCSCR